MGTSKTYAVNMADKHVTVRSLEVIDGLTGKSVRVIKQQLDALQETNQFQAPKVDYWSQLSDDGLITPVEKKTIKSEFANITAVHVQLEQQAQEQEKTDDARWINYDNTYYALERYLRDVLHIFDDMNVSTAIDDRDQFNGYFSVYYSKESDAQTLLTQGEPGRIRHLTSLNEYGMPGEVAVYNNWFYTYTTRWEAVPKDEFLGAKDKAPKEAVTNQYFLAKGYAILKELYIGAAGKIVSVAGKKLAVMERGIPGTIYVWDGEQWQPDNNKNSYRYLVATNDLIVNDYPISEALSTAIQGEAGTNGYLGMFTVDPEITQIKFNSYYVYIGENTDQRKKGNIYIYRKTGWEELKPEAKNYSYYMFTLNDTLQNNDLPVSAFAGLFAGFIAANNAFIEQLGSKFITLKTGGHIKSEEYDAGEEGFIMKSDGDIQSANFDGNTNKGYKLGKDGVITAKYINASGGTFGNIVIDNSCAVGTLTYRSGNYILYTFSLDLINSRAADEGNPTNYYSFPYNGTLKVVFSGTNTPTYARVKIVKHECHIKNVKNTEHTKTTLATLSKNGTADITINKDYCYEFTVTSTDDYQNVDATIQIKSDFIENSFGWLFSQIQMNVSE